LTLAIALAFVNADGQTDGHDV